MQLVDRHFQAGGDFGIVREHEGPIVTVDILEEGSAVDSGGTECSERAPVQFENEGKIRRLVVGNLIKGEVEPIGGKDDGEDVVLSNTEYWMGRDITVAKANRGKVRAYGRVWDFDGRSAEICQIDWQGPGLA